MVTGLRGQADTPVSELKHLRYSCADTDTPGAVHVPGPVPVDGQQDDQEAGGVDEGVAEDVVHVGEVEHGEELLLLVGALGDVQEEDLHDVAGDGEQVEEVGDGEGPEVVEGDSLEATAAHEEDVGDAADDSENDEDGADEDVTDTLGELVAVKAGQLEETAAAHLHLGVCKYCHASGQFQHWTLPVQFWPYNTLIAVVLVCKKVFNRPGVAGAVLQSPPSFIH